MKMKIKSTGNAPLAVAAFMAVLSMQFGLINEAAAKHDGHTVDDPVACPMVQDERVAEMSRGDSVRPILIGAQAPGGGDFIDRCSNTAHHSVLNAAIDRGVSADIPMIISNNFNNDGTPFYPANDNMRFDRHDTITNFRVNNVGNRSNPFTLLRTTDDSFEVQFEFRKRATSTRYLYGFNMSVQPSSQTIMGFDITRITTSLVPVSGSLQSTPITTSFDNPLSLRVALSVSGGANVEGVTVDFTASTVDGATALFPDGATAVTNNSGIASVNISANDKAGSYMVTATANGNMPSSSFSLTNQFGPADSVNIISGNGTEENSGQSAVAGALFAAPLVVQVTDSGGNKLRGQAVTFAVDSTNEAGATLSSTEAVDTDAEGMAMVTATADNDLGAYAVTATVEGITAARFSLTNTVGPAAMINIISGNGMAEEGEENGQSALIKRAFALPLVVEVTDSLGNKLTGIPVTFSAPATGASANLNDTDSPTAEVATDGLGRASVTAIANKQHGGPYEVRATVAGITAAVFMLTNEDESGFCFPVMGVNNTAVICL